MVERHLLMNLPSLHHGSSSLSTPHRSVPSSPKVGQRTREIPVLDSRHLDRWQRARRFLTVLYILKRVAKYRHLYGVPGVEYDFPPNSSAAPSRGATIRHTKKVSNEIAKKQHLPHCVISPNSKVKNAWNIVLALLLVYTATVMPFSMAFIDSEQWDAWFLMDLAIDGLFLLDVIVNLCSAYNDADGNLVTSHRGIMIHYLKTWLIIDLLACIPFGLIEEEPDNASSSGGDYNNLLRLLRLPRLYRLIRISRLIKMVKHYRNCEFIENIQDFLSIKHSAMRLIGSFLTILLCVHIVTCFWFYTAKLEGFHPDTWVVRGGYIDMDIGSLYITSMYWCFTTLSTVGYGDIVPYTILERFIGMAWMIFGLYFISFTIGSLSSMLSSIDTKENALVEKLAAIDEFAKEVNLDKRLKLRLRHALKYSTEKTGFSWSDKQSIFNELPRGLKHNIAMEMHRGAIKRLNFFVNKDQAMVSDIVPFLHPNSFERNAYIYEVDEHADEIYFLVKGEVSYVIGDPCLYINYISEGFEFGDIEVIFGIRRQYAVKAVSFSELLVMNRNLVSLLESEYHSVWEEMKQVAEWRYNENRRRKIELELRYERPELEEPEFSSIVETQLARVQEQGNVDEMKTLHLQHQACLKKKEVSIRDLNIITDNLFQFVIKLDAKIQDIKESMQSLVIHPESESDEDPIGPLLS